MKRGKKSRDGVSAVLKHLDKVVGKSKTTELTVEQFAKAVGSSVKAVELWRAKGLPCRVEKKRGRMGRPRLLIDLSKASDWLVANKLGGFGVPENTMDSPEGANNPNSISEQIGLVGAVSRAEAFEWLAGKLVKNAYTKGTSVEKRATLENWLEASKALADLKKRIEDREAIRETVQGEMLEAIREWVAPKRAFIESIPHAYGSRLLALPHIEEVESILREITTNILKQLADQVRLPEKPLPEQSDETK